MLKLRNIVAECILIFIFFLEKIRHYISCELSDSHEMSSLIFSEKKKKKSQNCICCSCEFCCNSFPASGDFCRLLITFANSLEPDQAWQNVGPDLDPNCLTLWWYSWKIFFKISIFKKIHRWQKSMQNYPACKELELTHTMPTHLRIHFSHHPSLFSSSSSIAFLGSTGQELNFL